MVKIGWDPVPYMIGGGAKHSVNVFRNVAHASFDGREGVVNPTDCEVRELTIPGSSVRVFPGTVAIKNRSTGARDEMYVGRLPSEDTVAIAATDGTGKRSDLIVARVENPFEDGSSWAQPTDPTVGPYIFSRVISNVPETTTSAQDLGLDYSMIALARVDIPASTGVILQSYITDLRALSSVSSQREFDMFSPTTTYTVTSSAYADWAANDVKLGLTIPEWATHVKLRAIMAGVGHGAAGTAETNVWGQIRMALVGATGTTTTQSTAYNLSTPGGSDTATLMAGAPKVAVPKGYRGKAATVKLQAIRSGGSTGANISMATNATVSIEAEFIRLTEANA